ncbi:MAG: MBL fold metallo-hydrolase [Hungatella hathewayi]|uniref:MBL fold metallo-hydrolase n=1 Tax=Hungatella TaxID=1649459 RepID=UPI001105C7CC|nr:MULTISPECIES: MBL fold metallo-hydrolase [Hungatella]MCI7380833.1 MBL fold metallo-hydrolase [Hungatella sp.]MDY6235828.1 MBL fold metallo-hydrolase [Hungatella hathewayi]
MNTLDFFSHKKINDHLYQIIESYAPCSDPGLGTGSRFNIYVVIGGEKAIVIDTGLGAVDGLRTYIENYITLQKPLAAYLTHTHPDHVGGAALFDEVYIHEDELSDLEWNTDLNRRMSDLELFANYHQDVIEFCFRHYTKQAPREFFRLIHEDDIIDLGGISLEVIKLPGHSRGSVLYYNSTEHYALGGDCVQIMNSYKGGKDSLNEYEYFLSCLISRMPEDIRIFSGHDSIIHTMDTLHTMKKGLCDVINGINLEHDIPKPPRFTMTRNKPQVMMHYVDNLITCYDKDCIINESHTTEVEI